MEIRSSSSQIADNDLESGRRSFLGIAIGVINTGIAAFLAVTIGRYTSGPKTAVSTELEWLEAGAISDIPDAKPTKLNVDVVQNAGWAKFNNQQSVWVVKKGDS